MLLSSIHVIRLEFREGHIHGHGKHIAAGVEALRPGRRPAVLRKIDRHIVRAFRVGANRLQVGIDVESGSDIHRILLNSIRFRK